MTDRVFYALLAEFPNQGPILLETEMEHASHDTARDRRASGAIRQAIVECRFVSGNRLLHDDMVDGAKRHASIRDCAKKEPF